MKKTIWKVLPLLGLSLFVYIVYQTGLENILSTLESFNPFYLFAIPFFILISLTLKGYKWKVLLNSCNQDLPLFSSIKFWAIGFFSSLITPGKSGDIIRAFYVKRDNKIGFAESLTTILIERIIDVVTLLMLTVISILLLVNNYQYELSVVKMSLIIILIIALFYIMTKKKWMTPFFRKVVCILPKTYHKGILSNIKKLYKTIEFVKKDRLRLLIVFILTFAQWCKHFYYMKLLTDGLGLNLSFSFIFIIIPIITFVELIPISVSGLGTREAALVALFSLAGLNASQAISFSFVYLFLGSWLIGIIGFAFWLRNPIPISIDLSSLKLKKPVANNQK